MHRQRFSDDSAPVASRSGRSDAVKDWLSLLLPPLAIVGLLGGFWLLSQIALTPSASLPPMAFSASPVPSTYPPEFLAAAVAISTFIAPTPTPTPTPTQSSTPTPAVPETCGSWTQRGAVCTMPLPPAPTATPWPTCPVTPGLACVWMGAQTGTPIAIGTVVKGT